MLVLRNEIEIVGPEAFRKYVKKKIRVGQERIATGIQYLPYWAVLYTFSPDIMDIYPPGVYIR